MKVNVVPVRRPLLAMCDLIDTGHDVHFVDGVFWAEHRKSHEIINIRRRGGKFEIDAEVMLPNSDPTSGNEEGQDYP